MAELNPCPFCGMKETHPRRYNYILNEREENTMQKLIYCKFLDHEGDPRGRDYTYLTDTEVQVGDFVEVEVVGNSSDFEPKKKRVVVTRVDVKPEDIQGYESFKDKIKKIKGLWKDEVITDEANTDQMD